jgi:hypothetical protein
MRKILISAPEQLANKIANKLRHNYDVELSIPPYEAICEIKANIRRNWITICRFASDENLDDILTMFEVNYELKMR